MSDADLAATIDAAWEAREKVSPQTKGAWRDAVQAALDGLEGQVARRRAGRWSARGLAGSSMAEEGGAAVVPPQRHGRDPGRPGRSGARRVEMVGQGAVEI